MPPSPQEAGLRLSLREFADFDAGLASAAEGKRPKGASKLVNGDTKATMTIRNSGNGSLAITVTDELQPGGARAKVTQLALSQR